MSIAHPIKLREIAVTLRAPDPSWSVRISRIVRVGEELRVVARLARKDAGLAPAMIVTIADRLTIRLPEMKVRLFVLRQSWTWSDPDGPTSIDAMSPAAREAFELDLTGGETWLSIPDEAGATG